MKNTKIIWNINNFKNKLEESGCLMYFSQHAHRATQNELSITSKESCTCLLWRNKMGALKQGEKIGL